MDEVFLDYFINHQLKVINRESGDCDYIINHQ